MMRWIVLIFVNVFTIIPLPFWGQVWAFELPSSLTSRLEAMHREADFYIDEAHALHRPRSDYEPFAKSVASKYNIPETIFLNLITVESHWQDGAKSYAGAMGLAQLMPSTARLLNVDPWDPFQNMEGGARYLRAQYDKFGSWKLALAAYNAGPGAVEKYGGVPPYKETQNYVQKILGS